LDELRKYWGEVDVVTRPSHITLKRYDLIIAQEPTFRIGLHALIRAKLLHSLLVCEVHGDYIRPRYLPLKDLAAARIVLSLSDLVRVVNNTIARNLTSWKIKKIIVIPSVYIKSSFFKPFTNPKQRRRIILSAARLVEEKGLDLLLEAIPFLQREFPDLEVRIVGDGPYKNKLQNMTKRLRIGGVVRFLGWLNQKELVKQYNEAAIFICTSYFEGGPRTVFEAAACLTPSVSTPVGIIPEVMRDGESVVLVRRRDPKLLAQKIKELLQDEGKRSYIAGKAREVTMREFEWSKAIKRYAQAYLNLLNQR